MQLPVPLQMLYSMCLAQTQYVAVAYGCLSSFLCETIDNNHYKTETTCMILVMQIMILNVQNLKNPYMWKKVTKYRVCMGVERNKVL